MKSCVFILGLFVTVYATSLRPTNSKVTIQDTVSTFWFSDCAACDWECLPGHGFTGPCDGNDYTVPVGSQVYWNGTEIYDVACSMGSYQETFITFNQGGIDLNPFQKCAGFDLDYFYGGYFYNLTSIFVDSL